MKCISIRQPYASLIVAGIKQIECRNWPTTFRGRVLIHAAKRLAERRLKEVSGWRFIEHWVKAGWGSCEAMPRGVLVGSAEIVDCIKLEGEDLRGFVGVTKRFTHGFVLAGAVEFSPEHQCELRGNCGFFDVDVSELVCDSTTSRGEVGS